MHFPSLLVFKGGNDLASLEISMPSMLKDSLLFIDSSGE